jgi:hypothetical protein
MLDHEALADAARANHSMVVRGAPLIGARAENAQGDGPPVSMFARPEEGRRP